jgi:pimeloyl-ACP methyl ester carboxylesterase
MTITSINETVIYFEDPGWDGQRMGGGRYGKSSRQAVRRWMVRQLLDSGPFIDRLYDDLPEYDPRPGLAETGVPLWHINGRDDAQVPVAIGQELAGVTPAAELVVIDDSGHMPHQEEPFAFNEAIRKFVTRCSN